MNGWLELVVTSAFIAGLMGGVHCAAMCGGIVGIVSRPRAGHDKPPRQWRYALAYNGGRIFSYTMAGALAGALGQGGLLLRGGPLAQHLMMFLAGITLLLLALYVGGVTPVARGIEAAGAVIWRRVQPYSRWFLPADTVPRALGLGAVWGWLPCGMVYALLLTAMATADARQGALVMFSFGIGTVPNLMAISLLYGQFGKIAALRPLRIASGIAIGGLGIFGILKATQAAAYTGDGLLCRALPSLSGLLQ